jgi:hypothetical protein
MARIRENNFLMDFEDTGLQPSIQQMLAPPPIAPPPMVQQPTKAPDKATIIDNLVKQIQARSNTSQWSGGVGADQATKDMARILAETGITDISQFGPITQQVEKIVGYDETTGVPIYGTVTEQTFGNKETGQAVPNTYTERQKGDFFGGTYEGKGNTGYGVQFDEQGNPTFFTQGASSRDSIVKAAIPIGALALGALGAQSLFGGALGGAAEAGGLLSGGGAGLTAAEAAGLGLTATEAAALGLPAAEFAAAGGGLLSSAAPSLAAVAPEVAAVAPNIAPALGSELAAVAPSVAAPTLAPEVIGMGGGTGITAGSSGLGLNAGTAGLGTSGVGAGITAGSGLTGTGVLTGSALGTGLLGTTGSTALTGTGVLAGSTLGTQLLGTGAGTAATAGGVGNAMANLGAGALNTGVGSALGSALGSGVGSLISGGLGTAGNLLQMQQSREAAQKAQAMIEAETEAAKQAAQFRPVGMTTRFGTSQFEVDPTTGRLISAGYTLTPEAKAQQDRLVALQNQGLTQAEQAQAQFAPLQTGAQSLFNLGNQYLAQSPQSVAQNYLNQQLALLQPGRELELANLQNRLQQQGRSGLSVAQGGSYGATTPELQALYNARAMQEAQLAAQAQQAGQQQVQFGAGLLNQGASAMGQYYGGQQAAYTPYTTASGQVQGLEALGQQPLTMSTGLGQTAAQAGANVGQLGLKGAGLSAELATSADATRNLAAQALIGAGNPSSMFGRLLGGLFD